MVKPSSQTAVEELQRFIASNPDAREMRKALALKLVYQGYSYEAINQILDVPKLHMYGEFSKIK